MPIRGYHHSEETKRKMSSAKIGEKHPMFGKHHFIETKQKVSKKLKGIIRSKETREKMSSAKSKSKHPLFGKHRSDKTKEKIRKGREGKYNGINNPNWKGGGLNGDEMARRTTNYHYWRMACLLRDKFTCQKTGVSGGKLNIHHINNFRDFPEFRLAIDNGITLSEKAHKEFHHIYGNKNNTREQLEEFFKFN
jgi:hypothetical protein